MAALVTFHSVRSIVKQELDMEIAEVFLALEKSEGRRCISGHVFGPGHPELLPST